MPKTGNWFTEWFDSVYYHKLYFERDDREAEGFINRLVNHLQPAPGSKMLDVCCGRGRHSRILARLGFEVTGIDLSPRSIAYAHAFESENLQFYQHDMRLPFRINFYDYAFNFFTSFGYFQTERENDNAVRTIANSLKQDGVFVIDYLNVHFEEDHLRHHDEAVIEGVNFSFTKWFDETHFYKKILIEDEDLEAPLEFTEKVAKFSLGDFNDMFAYHGLQIQEVFGDYDLGAYHVKNSRRLIAIARKIH